MMLCMVVSLTFTTSFQMVALLLSDIAVFEPTKVHVHCLGSSFCHCMVSVRIPTAAAAALL